MNEMNILAGTSSFKTAPEAVLWHLPAALMLIIYLPAALFGAYVFCDAYAASFLALLGIMIGSYYALYPRFANLLRQDALRSFLWRLGDNINWRALAWGAILAYLITLSVAALTCEFTPLGAALRGGNWMDIALARAYFLANREGAEVLLRYSAVILGRSIMPILLTYAYWSRHRARHIGLVGLLFCYLIALEKASVLFAFLPLMLLFLFQGKWRIVFTNALALTLCLSLWTFLAMGGLHDSRKQPLSGMKAQATEGRPEIASPGNNAGRVGDPNRHFVFNYLNSLGVPFRSVIDPNTHWGRFLVISNRAIWIPYITAYDWLKFQDDVLGGRLTLGRSIGVVSWFFGVSKLQLERMVYVYQFGQSPGGGGASNTVFFVDAKLAFGWLGAIIYCVFFVFFAAAVLTSGNEPVKIASVTSFFTACLSPLTATLLSGGLFFFMVIALLLRPLSCAAPQAAATFARKETS